MSWWGGILAFLAVAVALCCPAVEAERLGCTAILVDKHATVDGSTLTTHNADCLSCDFRMSRYQGSVGNAGTSRPVYKYYPEYPHVINDRGITWSADNLEDLPQRAEWQTEEFAKSYLLGYIPEVNHTYSLLEALFGIMNEKGVAIGESTCAARWFGKPMRKCLDCDGPLVDLSALSEIALERCDTARCAIHTIGSLSRKWGYYAADTSIPEGGEALTITDGDEAWMFHILPDATGDSTIWVAQRIPDGHISVVANAFVIREVDPKSPDFICSDNLFSEAVKHGLWIPEMGQKLDFQATYGVDTGNSQYSTRRAWRVLSLAAPSLNLPSQVPWTGDGLPFSVKAERPLGVEDIMAMNRDLYQGTQYDLTKGIAGGPFGDPARFDGSAETNVNQNGVSPEDLQVGSYERAISMFRTSYSFVAQTRKHVPSIVSSVVHFTQYAPHASVYTPLYVNAGEEAVPTPFTVGSLYKFDHRSTFWRFASVGNWAARFFKFAIHDVREVQQSVEGQIYSQRKEVEDKAVEAAKDGKMKEAEGVLSDYSASAADLIVSSYSELFETLIARYHDGYKLDDSGNKVVMNKLFYPRWWLKVSGFFHFALPAATTQSSSSNGTTSGENSVGLLSHVLVALLFLGTGVYLGRRRSGPQEKGYTTIQDTEPNVPWPRPTYMEKNIQMRDV